MSSRRIAWGIWGVTVALLVVWFSIAAAAGTLSDEWIFYVLVPVAILSYATVGALITSRHQENRIGLILAGVAFAFVVAVTAGDYVTLSARRVNPLPFVRWVTWVGRMTFALWLAPFPLLFLLYPNGRVLSHRWRPVLWVLLAALTVNLTLLAVTPGVIETGFTESGDRISNPLGLPLPWKEPIEAATELASMVAFICAGLAAISLVLRFRRAAGEERQQIRWLGYVGAVLVAVPLIGLLILLIRELLGVHVSGDDDVAGTVVWSAFMIVLMFGVPAACAVAVLRYRLYDLDVVVKRTVVFGLLVVLLTAVGGVVGALVATGVVPSLSDSAALLLLVGVGYGLMAIPLYRVAKRIADRVVFGGRSTPYEVLSSFTERISGTYSADDVLPRMAQLLGDATRATAARIWLRVGRELHAAATWPSGTAIREPVRLDGDDLLELGAEHAFEVRDGGELLGALSVELASSDPMDPSKEKLARDLAAQGRLVLRNVRLIEELRASRQRLVTAQDEERRRLERNIHDGAQQQLVALAVKQRLAASMVGRDDEQLRGLLTDLQSETNAALEDLRDLARGIYPPLLADRGLGPALESQARKSPVAVTIEAERIGRYAQETEAAVYFSCLEALQNVAKYADASTAVVRLAQANGSLTFEVSDDGRGFDPDVVGHGTGLQGMADRLAALGGEMTIHSAPGDGTTVRGSVPVPAGAPR